MREAKSRQKRALNPAAQAISEARDWAETPNGKLLARWNDAAAVTAEGIADYTIL